MGDRYNGQAGFSETQPGHFWLPSVPLTFVFDKDGRRHEQKNWALKVGSVAA